MSTSDTVAAGSLDEVQLFGSPSSAPTSIATPALITAMIDSGKRISDLIFSPDRPPQLEQQGELTSVAIPELRPEDTARVAGDLIAGNA